jgi:hypothetical protein
MSKKLLTHELWAVLTELDPATGKTKLELVMEVMVKSGVRRRRRGAKRPTELN